MNLKYTVSDSFRKRADPAAFWEAWVGATLARKGLYAQHHPFVVDGSSSHDQSWDLDVSRGLISPKPSLISFPVIPVECKSIGRAFNGPKDFPYDNPIVCSQNSWNKKWPGRDYTVRDFLFISTETGAVVWLPCMSQVTFGHETFDSKRDELFKAVRTDKSRIRSLDEFAWMVHDLP